MDSPTEFSPKQAIVCFLLSVQVLLRSKRLYPKNHPKVFESLEAAGHNLRAALQLLPTLDIGVEHGSLVAPALRDHELSDRSGEVSTLAQELSFCGITSLVFLPETNLGELDILAHLINDTLLGAQSRQHARSRTAGFEAGRDAQRAHRQDWLVRLEQHHISGIQVNTPLEDKVDTVLASLVAALLAYGGSPDRAAFGTPTVAATEDELTTALRLLARMAAPLDDTRANSPQEAACTFHAALAEADRRTVTLLVAAVERHPPRQEDTSESYVTRLGETLALQFIHGEFRHGRAAPPELRALFTRLGGPSLWLPGIKNGSHESGRAVSPSSSSYFAEWAEEAHAERLYERFWAELPSEELSNVLCGRDAWCVPVIPLRHHLERLLDDGRLTPHADADAIAGAGSREARALLLNYARGLESEEGLARRAVAAALAELHPVVERLWPNQLPEELNCGVLRALERETSAGIAGLIAAVVEKLAQLALRKADYAEFARILEALESAPRDADHSHMATLASQLVNDERWLELVDAALFNWPRSGPGTDRALNPALPRILRRNPGRLLDRLGLLLTAPNGLDALPAMVRLVRAIGEPAIDALEARLFEPRRQRATTAVKLLAAIQPERLVAALPRAVPTWDWSLQDLAISELVRPVTGVPAAGTVQAFLATLTEAHPMVVPMMLDHIGLAQETAAVPVLLEIAAGENERLREVFIRIKAIEALGRMRVMEAADRLREILRQRNGLTHAEPAGLRAAAEEALALIENWPSSARIRAAHEALEKASMSFMHPRRYLRIPLSSPFAAQIEGPHAEPARVRTISLGGAFLESKRQFVVGDSIRVEIRAGLRRIHSTAVVRNVAPNGGGVEFVHMKQEDREKLRRLVHRLLRT